MDNDQTKIKAMNELTFRFVPRPDLFNHSDRDPSKDCFCMAEEGCQNFPAGWLQTCEIFQSF